MKRRAVCALILASALAAAGCGKRDATAAKFDPGRDAETDVAAALAKAQREGKRVIVDVGGEWCVWCHTLDDFFAARDNADLRELRDARYVWVKVNYSKENTNEAFLSRWPKVAGYPHFFVLDAQGKLVHSQDTGELELGRSYDKQKMIAFLGRYSG
jgi:thiol:disulfide interchange protein